MATANDLVGAGALSVVREEDVVQLCRVLEGSFSCDQTTRRDAEAHLKQVEASPGLPSTLLTIIRRPEIDSNTRMAAAIFLKNEIRRHWERPLPPYGTPDAAASDTVKVYSEADKAVVRDSLFETLVEVCEVTPVRNMVEECLRRVALSDYPTQWPQILETVYTNLSNLGQVSEQRIVCSLLALRRLTGKYELDMRSDRQHLDDLIEKMFPLVLNLAEHLTKPDAPGGDWTKTTGKAMMMKLICAIYWSSTQMALAKGGEVNRTVDHWMALMERIMTSPIPADILAPPGSDDEESRSHLEQMKAKKRAMQIVHRFFSRYGTDKDEYKAFGKMFVENWSCKFLKCFVELLRNKHVPEWSLTKRMHSLIFQYLSQALEIAKTYKAMKENVKELLSGHCFPLLCYSEVDEEAWDFDPVDFVRSQNDLICAFADPREAAIEFIQTVARLRSKDFLSTIQEIAEAALQFYNASPLPKSQDACQKKDGALHLLGSIANRLASEKRKNPVGQFLVSHVFPDLVNENKFLRLRSCWTVERFLTPNTETLSSYRKAGPPPKFDKNQDLVLAFQKMLSACGDSELPVRIQAGTSIKAFFSVCGEYEDGVLRQAINDNLAEVVRRLFALMSDMDNEWVVATLQSLVEHFEDEVLPYAVQLTEALAQALVRLLGDEADAAAANRGGGGVLDETDSLTAGMSIAETILSILTSSNFAALKDKSKSQQLVASLTPVLMAMIHPDNPDFLDHGLRILGHLVDFSLVVTPEMWHLFERLHSAVCGGPATPTLNLPDIFRHGWAPDYLGQMLPVIHNFLMRHSHAMAGQLSVAENKTYLQLILEMATKGLDDNGDPNGPKHGLELLGHTFEAFLRGAELNAFMRPAFEVQWQFLHSQTLNKSTRGVMLRVWCTMMLYNTQLFLDMLREANIVEEVFKQFKDLSVLKTIDGKKIFLLAFGELLQLAVMSPATVPDIITRDVESVALQLAEQQQLMSDLRKKIEEEDDSSDGSFESEDSEEDLCEDDDAREKSQKTLGRLRAAFDDEECGDDDDDDEDDSYETEGSMEDIKCHSTLDDVDEMIIFGQLLASHRAIFARALNQQQLSTLDACIAQEVAIQTERRNQALTGGATTATSR